MKRLIAKWVGRRAEPAGLRRWDERKLEALKGRLAGLSETDPLWPLVLELVDGFVVAELGAAATPGLDDGEAHRFLGRLGMLVDLRRELEGLYLEAKGKKDSR